MKFDLLLTISLVSLLVSIINGKLIGPKIPSYVCIVKANYRFEDLPSNAVDILTPKDLAAVSKDEKKRNDKILERFLSPLDIDFFNPQMQFASDNAKEMNTDAGRYGSRSHLIIRNGDEDEDEDTPSFYIFNILENKVGFFSDSRRRRRLSGNGNPSPQTTPQTTPPTTPQTTPPTTAQTTPQNPPNQNPDSGENPNQDNSEEDTRTGQYINTDVEYFTIINEDNARGGDEENSSGEVSDESSEQTEEEDFAYEIVLIEAAGSDCTNEEQFIYPNELAMDTLCHSSKGFMKHLDKECTSSFNKFWKSLTNDKPIMASFKSKKQCPHLVLCAGDAFKFQFKHHKVWKGMRGDIIKDSHMRVCGRTLSVDDEGNVDIGEWKDLALINALSPTKSKKQCMAASDDGQTYQLWLSEMKLASKRADPIRPIATHYVPCPFCVPGVEYRIIPPTKSNVKLSNGLCKTAPRFQFRKKGSSHTIIACIDKIESVPVSDEELKTGPVLPWNEVSQSSWSGVDGESSSKQGSKRSKSSGKGKNGKCTHKLSEEERSFVGKKPDIHNADGKKLVKYRMHILKMAGEDAISQPITEDDLMRTICEHERIVNLPDIDEHLLTSEGFKGLELNLSSLILTFFSVVIAVAVSVFIVM